MRSRHDIKRCRREFRLNLGLLPSVVKRPGLANCRQHLGKVVPPTGLYGPPHASRLLRIAIAEDENQRQRRLAFRQVVTEMLAGLQLRARVIEHVIDQLKCGPQVQAVSGHSLLDDRSAAADDCPKLRRRLE
ncbi:MAG TPA: hypothetical protein PL117_11405 [Accumulibacter sp.]|uniref:hypothetical protein n=1 Tax=Accumulibacter sp. TaxID=2053492 RepID=UPI002B94B683|nr:hypothetical protein [Accumulibacter sp.]HRF73372.1 hypothetical protein [Accumulibacter sp.]